MPDAAEPGTSRRRREVSSSARLTAPPSVGLLRRDGRPLADLTGIRILVVEDNADALELLETVFRSCGAHTVAARNVVTALTFLETARFDVLVSDLVWPTATVST
jgi:PleD family two-component response regulator